MLAWKVIAHRCMGTIGTGRIAAGRYFDLYPIQFRALYRIKLFPKPSEHIQTFIPEIAGLYMLYGSIEQILISIAGDN